MEDDDIAFLKLSSSPEAAARDARHLGDLQGPGIVALQGVGADGLELEKAACSLADVLHERGPLPDSEVRAVGAAAAAALARVHDAGLVHGDVKPANLLLSPNGELWLTDFDAASMADDRPLERFSPGRLPPGAAARPTTDMAALALTLVELATGTLLDPETSWRTVDLRRLGCSPALSAEISFMLGCDGSTLNAGGAASMFERAGGSLPEPASKISGADSTPTVEFMPARSAPSATSARPQGAAAIRRARWWQRLAASWRPAPAANPSRSRSQASGSSQARRSS